MPRTLWMAATLAVSFALVGCFGGEAKTPADSAKTPETPAENNPQEPKNAELIYAEDLTYLGAFRVPSDDFAYGGTAITFNADRQSLFMVGHDHHQQVGEISIAEPKTGDIARLNTASLVQDVSDITQGQMENIGINRAHYNGSDGAKIGGLLLWKNKLLGAVYGYYDAEPGTDKGVHYSHFTASIRFNNGTFSGMYHHQ